jgi:RimJ/RimL family protein N-acetyltransferase
MPVPPFLRTERLLLRPWHPDDATRLAPVLAENVAHLAPWIPWRVAEPAPPPELAQRLAGFAADFAEEREWRYALLAPDESAVYGEVALFPRSAAGRVPLDAADRVEIGYWLRSDATGRGLATEAARAALDAATALGGMTRVEIRCDARNRRSAALPQRLGFRLESTLVEPAATSGDAPTAVQLWVGDLPAAAPAADV